MQRIVALKQRAFERANFDGYLIFNATNLIYFTGVPGTTALLIPEDGEPKLYVYSVNYEQAKHQAKSFGVELVKLSEDLMTKLTQQIQQLRIKNLAIDGLSVEGWRKLTKYARGKIRLKMKPAFVSQLRAIKDETEILLLRKACEFTNMGAKIAYEVLSEGMKEYEVAAEIEYAMRKHGCHGTAFDTAISSGPASAFPHGGCSDREIRSGDLVVVDFGAVYKNYHSDLTRTLVVGKPSEKQQKLFDIVKKAQQEALGAMKPNVKARDVDAVARRIIAEAGYDGKFVHGLGHGVGLDIHEPPILNMISKEKLQVGNVVTDEPGIYLVGYGGVRIEDTVLVTKAGPEKLTVGPYSLCKE